MRTDPAEVKSAAENAIDESLERLGRIERTEQRLWFLALALFLLLAVSLFLMETTSVVEQRAAHGWTSHVASVLKDYGLSGALLIVAWLICAYFYEKLVSVRTENRNLVNALETGARVLSLRNQLLDTWTQLSHSLITNFNLPRLLELIARTAAQVTESDCAAVILSEKGSGHLRLAAIYERGLQVQLAERVAAIVIRDGKPVCISPEEPPAEIARPDIPWDNLTCLAGEPLVAAEKVVGALLVGRLRPREPFAHYLLDSLDAFANQASIALEKAHLYGENQKQLDRLAKLLDDLHATQAQLTEAERAASLGVLSGGVAYVINNPVAGMIARADRLLAGKELDLRTLWEEVSAIRRQAARVAETLTGLLALARRPGGERSERVDINQTAHAILEVMRQEFRAAGIEVEESLGNLPHARANGSQVQQALLNLLVNALHQMPLGGRLSVRTAPWPDGWVQVEIEGARDATSDQIPNRDLGNLGALGVHQLETDLGFTAAEHIIRSQGGTIVATGDPDLGTRVCVQLPAADDRNRDSAPELEKSLSQGELTAAGGQRSMQ